MKEVAKKIVGTDGWSYLSWCRDRFGLYQTLRSYFGALWRPSLADVPILGQREGVFLRPGTVDQLIYDEVFLSKVYDLDLGEPLYIVDAGAHIGMAACFFAAKYPDATVIAIEPELSNYQVLLMNARRHGNIKPLRSGLWSHKTNLSIVDSSASSWAFRVVEDASGSGIQALGIADVMFRYKLPCIDILKMDIEGSEIEVLNNSKEWIGDVGSLIIELHDRFRPGCTEALTKAVEEYSYDKMISGENEVITNLRKLSA